MSDVFRKIDKLINKIYSTVSTLHLNYSFPLYIFDEARSGESTSY